jgi:hypothetical protein
MRLIALVAVLCVSVALVGCGAHSKDYLKKDGVVHSIVVPSGVPMIKQEPYYPVPPVSQNASTKPVTVLPPTLVK